MNGKCNRGWRTIVGALAIGMVAFGLSLQGAPASDGTTAPPEGGKVEPVVGTASDLLVSTAAAPAEGVLPGAAEPESAMSRAFAAPRTGDDELRFARLKSMDLGSGAGRDTWHDIPCTAAASEGDTCDCDSDCCNLTTADGCKRGECRENPDTTGDPYICEIVDALQNARCDGDVDWCTEEWCDGFGVCQLLNDNQGGRLKHCAKECYGGGRDGLWCVVGSECPGGRCDLKPNAECDDSGGTNEEFCAVNMSSGALGRCCDAGSCSFTLEGDCTALWRRVADPDDMGHCWCPEYSSGIAPQDDETTLQGPIRPSPMVCETGGNRCEGTGSADCVDRCVGGPTVGQACNVDADCGAGGACTPDNCIDDAARCHDGYLNLGDDYSLASGEYMRLNEIRFRGGVENPGEVIVAEFWDTAYTPPKYVNAVAMQIPRAGIFTWTFQVDCYPDCSVSNNEQPDDPPMIIPPNGYMVIRSTRNEEPDNESNFWIGLTDVVDVGTNSGTKMWVDGDPDGSLASNVMMFELVGQVLDPDPIGACCIQDPERVEQCEDTPQHGCGICTGTDDEIIRCSQARDCGVAAGVQRFCVYSSWFGPQSHNDFIPPQAGELCGAPPTPCDRGACCNDIDDPAEPDDGTCTVTEPGDCPSGSTWLGAGTRCEPNCCPQAVTGADCACDTYICATDGAAECYADRVCSGDGTTACVTVLDCPIGDTCDPNFNGTPCTYTGPGEQSDCPAGQACGAAFTGSQCEPENGDADCDTGETCEMACAGPDYLDLQLPGQVECIDKWTDPFDPSESCTFGPAGDVQCNASVGCLFPPCECAFVPAEAESYAFTGNSEMAFFSRRAGDQCNLDNQDMGWHEGFIFVNQSGDPANDCAIITVDFCCNDTIKTPVWLILRSECPSGDCIWNSPMADENGNPAYGYGFGCGAQHCCVDGNYAASYQLYPGTYSWQIYGAPTCEGTVQDCLSDDDCLTGTQCLPNLGDYKGHFTIEACPIAACCIEDTEICVETNQLQCESSETADPPGYNGLWLGQGAVSQPTLDCGFEPCLKGVCCLAPEDVPLGDPLCNDDQDHDTLPECKASTSQKGIYIGGVVCADDPCPVCLIESPENCKAEDPAGGFIIQSNIDNDVRVADDFIPTDPSITKVCWAPAFLHPDAECSDPDETPEDHWWITFYEDIQYSSPGDAGWPGVEAAPRQEITVDAKVHRGVNSRVWDYSGRFDEVTVVPGECYWMEIQGDGSKTCFTYLTTGVEANTHGMYDVADYGTYQPTDARGDDYQFCLDCGISGSTDCGAYYRACCQCGEPPCEILTRGECDGLSPPGGFMLAENSCDPNPCPGIPPNDDCVNAVVIEDVKVEGLAGKRIDFNNVCATDDGPIMGCGAGDLHFDIWYYYDVEAAGDLIVSMCNLASFDTILVFYEGAGGPAAVCTPSHMDEEPNDIGDTGCNPPLSGGDCCGDDTCNITSGPSELSAHVAAGDEVLIRVGGWYDAGEGVGDGKGWGAFSITLDTTGEEEGGEPPKPEVGGPGCTPEAKFCHGGTTEGVPCLVNEDCPPNPGGLCLDDCWDEWLGASCVVHDHATGAARCYAPKNRYATIDARTTGRAPTAYYITLDTDSAEGLDVNDPPNEGQYASCGEIAGFLSEPVCIEADLGQPSTTPPDNPQCQGETACTAGTDDHEAPCFGWVSYFEPGSSGVRREWEEYPLFVAGCEMVPAATYVITASLDGGVPDVEASDNLVICTAHEPSDIPQGQYWGDLSGGPIAGDPPGDYYPTDYTMSFNDVSMIIATFAKTGPPREWSDMKIDHVVNMDDIFSAIGAFSGTTYPGMADINDSTTGRPLIGHEPCDCP